MPVTNGPAYPEPPDERMTMGRMARFAKRLGGAHARAGVLASVARENPLLIAVAGIGFSVSYQTIAGLARAHGMPGPAVLYPIGIDVGILAMIAEALHLIREGRSDFVPRVLAWLLAGFTIYVNVHGSPAGDWVGGGLHVVMPALWVAGLELVRHRRVAQARADGIPGRRWVAAPFTTARLWLRMQRDGLTSYPLALELEQARLYARDLIRATPGEYRPAWSSLLRKRIRSGRLTETARKAVRGSLAAEYAPGWEEAVTEWVTTALALPAHLAANLENTRAAIARSAAASASADLPAVPAEPLPAVPATAPAEVAAEPSPAPSRSVSRSVSARRRAVSLTATDDELAELVLPLFDGPDEVRKYGVNKAPKEARGTGVRDDRAGRILDLARRKHRERRVVPMTRAR
jgi:Protein of unknown function (DUF2637)